MCINNSKQFTEISEILENISSQYSEESKEYKALVLCAKAIWFIYSKNLQDTFMEYLETGKIILDENQIKTLKDIGYF